MVSYREGRMNVNLRTRDFFFFDSEFSGIFQEHTPYEIDPDGSQKSLEKTFNGIMLFPPSDESPTSLIKTTLWSAGRGYAQYLDEITEVDPKENGTVRVTAKGFRHRGANGIWNLVIEPESQWLVREATFFSQHNPDEAVFHVKNEGLLTSKTLSFATGSVWIDNPSLDSPVEFEGYYEDASDRFTQEVFAAAKKVMDPPYPEITEITDYRADPPIVVDTARLKRESEKGLSEDLFQTLIEGDDLPKEPVRQIVPKPPPEVPEPRSNPWSRDVFIVILCLIVLAGGGFYLRTRLRKAGS